MTESLIIADAPELQEIEVSSAATIKAVFEPFTEALAQFEDRYAAVIAEAEVGITDDVMDKAKQLRLGIARVRINAEKVRKAQKEQSLRVGKAIDGVSNIIKWAVVDKEKALQVIEDHFQNMERQRLKDLQEERVALLGPYVEDAAERVLCDMDPEVWAIYLKAKKAEYEDRIAAEEAKANADADERERLKKENEQLRADADAKAETDQVAKEAREKEEADLKAKHDAEIKAEQDKASKAEADLKAKEEADAQAKADAEAKVQADLEKGDAAKKRDLLADLQALTTKYTFKSKKNQAMFSKVGEWIEVVINRIKSGEVV